MHTKLSLWLAPPVKWNVYKTEMTISKKQVKEFYNIFGHTNNRSLQNTNNRAIME
jgi:carbonic anhydrase